MLNLLFLLSICCANSQNESTMVNQRTEKISPLNLTINTLKDTLTYTTGIRSILHASNGDYWFGSHQEGVCLFDGNSFQYFTMDDGLSENQVRTIQEDANGIIWFGTAKGVSSYDGKRLTDHTKKYGPIPAVSKKENNWKLTNGDLWFNAGNQEGVYRVGQQEVTYLPLPVSGNGNNLFAATGFSKGKDILWIATYSGVIGYNGSTFKTIDDHFLGFSEQSKYMHVRSVLEDSKGNLWIGNNGIGVLRLTKDTITHFSEDLNLVHVNSAGNGNQSPKGTLEHVFAIYEDQHGNIWFGDRDTGAWRYDGNSIANFTIDKKLGSQMIWQIYEDRNGRLLFAMANGGVYEFMDNTFERRF